MEFTEIIKKVNSDKRLKPDLLKADNGNNFRAVSESAILDVIDPILKEAGWYYTTEIMSSDLQIREAYGSKGKKLQFIATVTVKLDFINNAPEYAFYTEAVGMGIDDNDKAMGKAYTYAVKYALLKLFRLRFGDDPDYKASEPLYLDKPKEKKEEEKPVAKPKANSATTEKLMSEAQKEYIIGMMAKKNIPEAKIIGKFKVEPSFDKDITMRTARAIIQYLEEYVPEEDEEILPF